MINSDIVNQRLRDLREVMQREHLAAFIFPSTDPHQSEYVADHWKGREFISGFNGSAGTAVVTMTSAALWTDSRYFLAAEEQLKGTEYQLMKLKIEGTPTIAEWLGRECGAGAEVGIDGWCSSANEVKALIADLRRQGGITLRTNLDPLQQIWPDRPAIPKNPVVIYPLDYAGESCHEKITRIRKALREKHADGMLMTALYRQRAVLFHLRISVASHTKGWSLFSSLQVSGRGVALVIQGCPLVALLGS